MNGGVHPDCRRSRWCPHPPDVQTARARHGCFGAAHAPHRSRLRCRRVGGRRPPPTAARLERSGLPSTHLVPPPVPQHGRLHPPQPNGAGGLYPLQLERRGACCVSVHGAGRARRVRAGALTGAAHGGRCDLVQEEEAGWPDRHVGGHPRAGAVPVCARLRAAGRDDGLWGRAGDCPLAANVFCVAAGLQDPAVDGERHHAAVAAAAVASATSAVSWRPAGIVHPRNEVFLDVIETVHVEAAADGTVLGAHIDGAVRVKPYLSGMPDLKLGLADNVKFATLAAASADHPDVSATNGNGGGAADGQVLLEDVHFHQCVRLGRFASEGIITFVPPDSEFDLLTYRIPTVSPAVVPLSVTALIDDHTSATHIGYDVRVRAVDPGDALPASMWLAGVTLSLPAPADADTPRFKTSSGKAKYVPAEDAIVWKMSKLRPGGRRHCAAASACRVWRPRRRAAATGRAMMARAPRVARAAAGGAPRSGSSERRVAVVPAPGAVGFPVVGEGVDRGVMVVARRQVCVGFEVSGLAPSGMKVRFLTVSEASGYRAWVRYLMAAGRFHVKLR
eukprot:TRINITY_DN2807_c0_g1_i4.p1 TRINITY_DN2807_c0_g1~~TRINITY_DN2807_c0_g1_i4.p1  ORF type:complete len:561 (-),score=83.69 TRINITY_DN2807_c0_g1_i4:263-1945(-)